MPSGVVVRRTAILGVLPVRLRLRCVVRLARGHFPTPGAEAWPMMLKVKIVGRKPRMLIRSRLAATCTRELRRMLPAGWGEAGKPEGIFPPLVRRPGQ